ncbi:hypothetical protein AVEN_94273-1 [Araneus ventricosus]|uniref:Integrase zinc-binding domain-containing protein n=1 Tax=Araneus ventricosus TaxID=182803 RepID=A0A4Y2VRB9_ARAVE|nr:hypothetical protein AVEN_94273-1 [Araneus ventricosus]
MTIEDAWSLSETQKAQLEDADIRPILEKKLKSAVRPSWQEIALESPAIKRDPAENELQLIYKKVQLRDSGIPKIPVYWDLWDSLCLKDGDLYRKWESDDGSSCQWQLIFPKSKIQEVLRVTHDSASEGHFGVMKTLRRMRQRFFGNVFVPTSRNGAEFQAYRPTTEQGKPVIGWTCGSLFE